MTAGALAGIATPAGWKWQELWAVMPRVKEVGGQNLTPLSVYLDSGVVPRDSRTDNHNQLGEDLSRYLVVRPDDIVFNKLRTWQGGLGHSKYYGIVSPAYFVCRSKVTSDSRFLHYLLHSNPYLAELTRISKWMPPSQFDTPWETLRKLPLLLPPAEEQRRIADFLDAETAHIDRLAELQRKMIVGLNEREAAQLDIAIDDLISRAGMVPLRRFVWSVDQGSSPQCDSVPASEDEWGVLKVSCLRPGVFDPRENKRLPAEIQPDSRNEVREGDLLITRANTPQLVGSTAVVRQVRRKILLSDKIFRVRLSENISPEFVAAIARGSRVRSLSAAGSNGASSSMANIRFEEVKQWPMPAVSLPEQMQFVERVSRSRRQLDALRPVVNRRITLLAERRQALITAAVTGQFDVSTASGRNATEGVTAP